MRLMELPWADRPVCTAVLACFLAGSIFVTLGRFIHHLPQAASPPKLSVIPLAERCERPSGELPTTPNGFVNEPHGERIRDLRWWKRVALVAAIGCIRVVFFREITLHSECAPTGYSYAIPFLVSIYDYWRNQRYQATEKPVVTDSLRGCFRTLFTLCRRAYFSLCQSRLRYVISAAFVLAGGLITSRFDDGKESTYICPITSGLAPRLHIFKILSVFLDSLILIGAAELSRDARPHEARKQTLVSWGYGLLVSLHMFAMGRTSV